MSPQIQAMLGTYARAFLAIVVTAIAATGKAPWAFDSSDWALVANAVWCAALPVIARAINPNDTAYGSGSAAAADASTGSD